jgi:regulator of protease activity HflC (stomatin/prohibitin superfamily)
MARRKLLAENLAAIARGILLMLAGIALFGESQNVVIPDDNETTQALLAVLWFFIGAFFLMPEAQT